LTSIVRWRTSTSRVRCNTSTRLEPFAQLRAEGRIVECKPPLVDDQQRGPPVEPALYAMEQIGEHGGCRSCTDQPFGLEGLNVGLAKALGFGVE